MNTLCSFSFSLSFLASVIRLEHSGAIQLGPQHAPRAWRLAGAAIDADAFAGQTDAGDSGHPAKHSSCGAYARHGHREPCARAWLLAGEQRMRQALHGVSAPLDAIEQSRAVGLGGRQHLHHHLRVRDLDDHTPPRLARIVLPC